MTEPIKDGGPALLDEVLVLANERHEIDSGPNIRGLLEAAEEAGFVEIIPGRIKIRDPQNEGESVNLLGKTIPITRECWSVYRLTDNAMLSEMEKE